MYLGHKVAVVIPCFNAEEHIAQVVDTLPRFVDFIVMVDDCSTDGSIEAAKSVGRDELSIVRHQHNMGVGAAISTGYERAILLGADVVVVVAADGQMDPSDMPALLEPVVSGRVNYAKGNRFLHPEVWRAMPPSRLFGNVVLSLLTKPVSGYWHIFDSQCGYTAIDSSTLGKIELDKLWKRYGYPNDLLARLHVLGASVVDVPVRPVYHDGHSKMNLLNVAMLFPPLLLRIWASRIRDEFSLRGRNEQA